jgi:hypothetical protein
LVEYLTVSTTPSLESFELAHLNASSNTHKKLARLIEEFIEHQSNARIARILRQNRHTTNDCAERYRIQRRKLSSERASANVAIVRMRQITGETTVRPATSSRTKRSRLSPSPDNKRPARELLPVKEIPVKETKAIARKSIRRPQRVISILSATPAARIQNLPPKPALLSYRLIADQPALRLLAG